MLKIKESMFKRKYLKIYCVNCLSFGTVRSDSTIFALSSGLGKCGVSVVRVSGPGVRQALEQIGGFQKLPEPRRAILKKIRNPITKEVIDHGLVFWFPSPKSFTGEDCCEFHVHGSTAVVAALLGSLGKLVNFRPAEPGEFTKRAFYSGKMDLTAVEGLSALIDSETEVQRKHALYQMGGALFSLYSSWTDKLLKSLAYIEAYIDFDEDQDIDKDTFAVVHQQVSSLIHDLKSHLEDGRRGERIREGVNMTILGAPNSGKSSLLNTLSKRPAAIVSSIPGTTRDVIQTHHDLNGYPVNVADTAGLREDPADQVETEGISRALACADKSDLLLFVLDVTLLVFWALERNINLITSRELKMYFEEMVQNLGIGAHLFQCDNLIDFIGANKIPKTAHLQAIIVLNKVDLLESENIIDESIKNLDFVCEVSCKTEYGVECLLKKMTTMLENLCGDPKRYQVGFSKPYQRFCLEECLSCLTRYIQMESEQSPVDLCAEELRKAITCLGRLTGKVSTEQLLDVIFKDFCIGK